MSGAADKPCPASRSAHRWDHGQPDPAATVQRWMTLDLYNAVMGDLGPRYDFDEWFDREGFVDAWAALCAKVRGVFDA